MVDLCRFLGAKLMGWHLCYVCQPHDQFILHRPGTKFQLLSDEGLRKDGVIKLGAIYCSKLDDVIFIFYVDLCSITAGFLFLVDVE